MSPLGVIGQRTLTWTGIWVLEPRDLKNSIIQSHPFHWIHLIFGTSGIQQNHQPLFNQLNNRTGSDMDATVVEPLNNPGCHVVAMPYPGRGHINPMMSLCKVLSSKKKLDDAILITFVVTEEWHGFLTSETKPPPNIRFATIPNCIPSEIGRSKDLRGFLEAVSTKMEAPFEQLLDGLQVPVDVIIADTFLAWVVKVGNRRRVPVASLWTQSAAMFSLIRHFNLLKEDKHFPGDLSEQGDELIDYIPGVPPIRLADVPAFSDTRPGAQHQLHRVLDLVSPVGGAQFLLFNSVYQLEAPVFDGLRLKFPFPFYPIGPVIPQVQLEQKSSIIINNHNVPDYIKWLDSQPEGSVLYVSMESFASVSSAQVDEIAAGLQDSGVRFLLVSRGESTWFQNGCGDKGLVVPWCDQIKVLCHPSVGGFWTHCGWNSTVEAVFAGVPMLTAPVIWDQFPNSKAIVEDWKIGWRVKKREVGNDDRLVMREEVAELVRSFMDQENNEMKEMRERARQIRDVSRTAIVEGGSSDINLDSFIREISKGKID